MNILITGSYGQLGTTLSRILADGKSRLGSIPEAYEDAQVIAVDYDALDITDSDAVEAFIENMQPDLILNCAAMTNVDGCEEQFETAMKVNAIGPRNLAMAATKVGAKLVHVSTDYVFRGDGMQPYCEWDKPDPNTIYGRSKRLGEEYVLQQCHRSFVVRTAWLYGLIGKNFVKTMQNLGRTKDAITVVSDQRGNPTNAEDLAHEMLEIAVTEEYGIYHCTCEGECSWYEFACRIMELSGLSCKVNPCTSEEYPSKTPRPAYSSLNNLMLKTTVGNRVRNWEDALADYITQLNQLEGNAQ